VDNEKKAVTGPKAGEQRHVHRHRREEQAYRLGEGEARAREGRQDVERRERDHERQQEEQWDLERRCEQLQTRAGAAAQDRVQPHEEPIGQTKRKGRPGELANRGSHTALTQLLALRKTPTEEGIDSRQGLAHQGPPVSADVAGIGGFYERKSNRT
jgi:hypothetical protein